MTEAVAPGGVVVGGASDGAKAPPAAIGPRPPITLGVKALYGFGSIAFGIKDNGFRVFLLLFYNQVVGLPAVTVGIAIGIATFLDCLIDPFVGRMSDNFRSRWGRRHPFMYASAIPVALSFLLLWNPPTGWSDTALIIYLAVVVVVVRTFIVLYEIPSSAMAAELTRDYAERSSILGWRYFFAWWGGLTLTVIMFWFFLRPTAEYPDGQLNRDGYALYGYVAAVLMFVSILVSAIGTHRFIPWLPQPGPKVVRPASAALKEVLQTLAIRPFLTIAAVGLLAAVAQGVSFSLAFYFSTYFWELNSFWTGVLVLDSYISSAVALAAAPMLTKRSGKKAAGGLLLLASVLIGFLPLLLRVMGWFPGNEDMIGKGPVPEIVPWLFVDGVVRGILGITAAILITSMLADVVEYSEARTGRRSEGLFFAFTSLIQKAVGGIGVIVASTLLAVVQFPDNAKPGQVPEETLTNLALIYMPTLIILYGLAVAVMQAYNITRQSHEETLRGLAAKAQAAEDASLSQVP